MAKRARLAPQRHTLPSPAEAGGPGVVEIQLLCTNDLHSKMRAREGHGGGLERRATALTELRANLPHSTLVLDAGDHFSGSAFFSFLQGECEMVRLFARTS